jgi:hypothetical protein
MANTRKKMSLRQPEGNIEKAKEDFINEPEIKFSDKQEGFPWQQDGVNERVISPFNLRLPEPMKLKIEWIVNNSLRYKSMHDFFMKLIAEKVDDELKKLT